MKKVAIFALSTAVALSAVSTSSVLTATPAAALVKLCLPVLPPLVHVCTK